MALRENDILYQPLCVQRKEAVPQLEIVGQRVVEALPPLPYMLQLTADINHAKERVLIREFHMTSSHPTDLTFRALGKAAERGVHVELRRDFLMDWIEEMAMNGFDPHKENGLDFIAARTTAEKIVDLKQRGVIVSQKENSTNKLLLRTFIGRQMDHDHTKTDVVDDIVYIGGVNKAEETGYEGLHAIDLMLRIENRDLADGCARLFGTAKKPGPFQDYSEFCGNGRTLLADGGNIGKSNIYGKTVDMIMHADKEIVLFSALPPGGKMLDAIVQKAENGTPVVVYLSDRNDHHFGVNSRGKSDRLYRMAYNYFCKKIQDIDTIQALHCKERKVHAKLARTENVIAVGSHNNHPSGILFGTRETQLLSTNAYDVQAVKDCEKELLDGVEFEVARVA